MVRRKLTLAERWQAVGLSQAGCSNRSELGVNHFVIDGFLQCLQATGMVDEHPRFDSPRKTTHGDDMLIALCA